ncbi:hypothetical protein [Bacillus phage vB_BanS-Thrax4]|nr:hypothetical protein [Bacillus phage vB_BanS-Thrax4]
MNKELIEEFKNHKWFACDMDNGFIASANTRKELLAKFGRKNAKHVYKGIYEFKESNSLFAWTVNLYHGLEYAKVDGYLIDDERNTWHKNL